MVITVRRLKNIPGYFPRLPGADRKSVISHARRRGIEKYDFTNREYTNLRKLAVRLHLKPELIAEFDKDHRFMHECPRLMRIGKFNSIAGMCYDIAIKNYAEIAEAIEKTKREFNAGPESSFDEHLHDGQVFFYPFKPKQIPRSHRYRQIDFAEFKELFVKVHPPIFVDIDFKSFVLYTILRLNPPGIEMRDTKMGEEFALPTLGPEDVAVLIEHWGVSTFMGWITPRDREGILKKTRFGIIEPVK